MNFMKRGLILDLHLHSLYVGVVVEVQDVEPATATDHHYYCVPDIQEVSHALNIPNK